MKVFYGRDKERNFTGTTCVDIDGILGFSFCFKGSKQTKRLPTKNGHVEIIEHIKPDQFDKKRGRKLAENRAKRFKKLTSQGYDEQKAWETIYSPRILEKTMDFMTENSYRFKEEPTK